MTTWKIEIEPQKTVGSKTVFANVSCDKGNVSLTGVDEAVQLLIESLNREAPLANSTEMNLMRFVFVNKDGLASAMAFECATDEYGFLSLSALEQIENYASKKLGESVLAETWSVMARAPLVIPVGSSDDVIGGVKCDSPIEEGDSGDENDAKLK